VSKHGNGERRRLAKGPLASKDQERKETATGGKVTGGGTIGGEYLTGGGEK